MYHVAMHVLALQQQMHAAMLACCCTLIVLAPWSSSLRLTLVSGVYLSGASPTHLTIMRDSYDLLIMCCARATALLTSVAYAVN